MQNSKISWLWHRLVSKKPQLNRINAAYGRFFDTEDGQIVLADLFDRFVWQSTADNISDDELRTLYGKRQLVINYILTKIRQENKNG